MSIEIQGINKVFGSFKALDDVNLHLPEGELVALLGPSGSGKTTLLRILAGLERADAGQVRFMDEDITHQKVRDRQVGFVFQHYALFRHLTVYENVAYGLRSKPRKERPAESEIKRRVDELLHLVQLDWTSHRFPDQLSGGQRQRIALARALAVQPKFLLLDEPFGALDTLVRRELRRWLRNLQRELGLTTILVTHDQEEAMEVSDRIVVLNHGRIEDQGEPWDVYEHTQSPFVFEFLGEGDRLDAQLIEARGLGRLTGSQKQNRWVYARPQDWEIRPASEVGGHFQVENVLQGLRDVHVQVLHREGDLRLNVAVPRRIWEQHNLNVGESVDLWAERLRTFEESAPKSV
jgi:sulfate transport system ATP-binding protein